MEKTTKSKISDAKREANKRYDKKNTIGLGLKFMKNTEADIIERLQQQDSKAGYIKRLIREDIAREKQEKGVK